MNTLSQELRRVISERVHRASPDELMTITGALCDSRIPAQISLASSRIGPADSFASSSSQAHSSPIRQAGRVVNRLSVGQLIAVIAVCLVVLIVHFWIDSHRRTPPVCDLDDPTFCVEQK